MNIKKSLILLLLLCGSTQVKPGVHEMYNTFKRSVSWTFNSFRHHFTPSKVLFTGFWLHYFKSHHDFRKRREVELNNLREILGIKKTTSTHLETQEK